LTPKVKNYKNKTYSAGFLFGEGAKEALEKQGYKDTYSYVALDLYNKEGKINSFGANPLKSFQIKKIVPVYNEITKEMEPITKIFQQVVDEQGNPILFNQKTENFMVDGKIKVGVNAKVIYKEVQKRGNGQYGIEYGDVAFNFPKVETVPNDVLISLRTAGFNMTLDQILQQSFEDIIETETTIPDVNKKVKSNLDKKLVDYINSLIPNYIKTNSDKVRIVSELASMFMLNQDFQTNEELLKNSQDVEKMIKAFTPQELKEEDKDTLDNMIANAIIEKLAKDGLSEKDIYDNFFGKNNADLKPTPTTQSSTSFGAKSLGSIKLNIIEDWVQSGQATTTVRNSSYHNSFYKGDGIYTTDKGNLVNITYKGLVKLQGNKVVGNNISYTKDKFAKAEGFGTWTNFQKNAKYAGKTLIDGGSVHLYNITTTQSSTTKSQINKNKPDGLPAIDRTPENCQ